METRPLSATKRWRLEQSYSYRATNKPSAPRYDRHFWHLPADIVPDDPNYLRQN